MDKISIVVPVYNAEHTLRRCVESLVLGKYKEEIEIILVEDQSKDNSWDICLELQNDYTQVRTIQNPRNSGPSYSRNRGMEEATGNLLLFVDSDDWVSCNYIDRLYSLYNQNKGSLVLCGYKFFLNKIGERKEYLFTEKNDQIVVLEAPDRYFKLLDCILLQQIWNKIFDLKMIKANNLCFDENQTMGEDTQFVLDYLRVAAPNQCIVLNEPLYYYIRTDQSLMAIDNTIDLKSGENRLRELFEISGERSETVADAYNKAVENYKMERIYTIMHSDLPKGEKTSLIKKVCPEEKVDNIFHIFRKTIYKEKLYLKLKRVKNNYYKLCGIIRRKKQNRIVKKARFFLKKSDFTIISQNCIGGVFYHDMGLEFSSPTVNLFFKADDFVKLVLNLEYYMSLPVCMEWGEEYPVGVLDDISICFMHYLTCKEAADSWERRKQRIDYSRIFVLSTDMEGFSAETFEKWNQIVYPKLLFTANKEYVNEDSLFFPEFVADKQVPDLIPGRKFLKDYRLIKSINESNW